MGLRIGFLDFYGIDLAMRVDVLVFDGLFDLGFAAVLDTLTTANELASELGEAQVDYDVRVVGMSSEVRTGQGLRVSLEAPRPQAEATIISGLGQKTPSSLEPVLDSREVQEACAWLRRGPERGQRVLAACTGSFVLAETGLLDGKTATTTWWLSECFRHRYPHVELDPGRMVVDAGSYVTAGAALAHLDLALWLVRCRSPRLADLVGHYLMVESRATVTLHAIPDHLAHSDPLVQAFERWSRDRLADTFSISEAARAIGTSGRTLTRRVRAVLGKTPLGYVQDLRVDWAIHRLRTSDDSVDDIAEEVGYADGVTLRTLLRRKTGRGVRELRRF